MRKIATNVFDLFAKISLDSSGYEKNLSSAKEKFSKVADGIKTGVSTIAKVTAGAVASGTAAVGALAKSSLDSYASYEQLVGGVETLFKDSADKVQQYADNAYKTAGMSANQYMEQLTSFASSLIQSTGRGAQQDIDKLKETQDAELTERKRYWEDVIDLAENNDEKKILKRQREDDLADLKRYHDKQIEEAEIANSKSVTTAESLNKAADIGNMIMIDMSDNANKMGTAMESIQNAYQGFAKQNYTMLDNLKIGYGGTKAEAERLVNTAAEMTDIQAELGITIQKNNLDFDNLAQAIHVVQYQMGITETTSKEAASTIEGSAKSMKAAWDNLIVEMGKDDGNTTTLIDVLVGSVETNLDNVIPRIERILNGIGDAVVKLSPVVSSKLPKLIDRIFPVLLKSSTSLVKNLLTGIAKTLPTMIDTFGGLAVDILAEINKSLRNETDDNNNFIKELFDSATKHLPSLKHFAKRILDKLIDDFNEKVSDADFTTVGEKIVDFISGAVETAIDFGSQIDWVMVGTKLADAMNSIDWGEIIHQCITLIGAFISGSSDIVKGWLGEIDWANLGDMVALLFAPKIISKIGGWFSSEAGNAAIGGAASTLGTVFVSFIAGWGVGTAIRKMLEAEFGEEAIDEFLEPWLENWWEGWKILYGDGEEDGLLVKSAKAAATGVRRAWDVMTGNIEDFSETYGLEYHDNYQEIFENSINQINARSSARKNAKNYVSGLDLASTADYLSYVTNLKNQGVDTEVINELITNMNKYMNMDKTLKVDVSLNNGNIVVEDVNEFLDSLTGGISQRMQAFSTLQNRMAGGRGY